MDGLNPREQLISRFEADVAEHATALGGLAAIGDSIAQAAEVLIDSAKTGGTLLVCGNGGSAADSQHIVAEYLGRFLREREPLPAIALSTNSSAFTAIGNDYGFEQVFSRQVRAHARPGDVLLGISTSGDSPNVRLAIQAARECGAKTIALVGPRGGTIAETADVAVLAPGATTPRIQEMHILIAHIWCGLVEEHACARP
jgi:D-sedoheptulose 7-phosphate isomerase